MAIEFDNNGMVEVNNTHKPAIIDEPISMQIGTGTYYYLFDGLGSVTGLTDSGGNLVATYSYDAFGNILSETGDATLNAINPYRYTSRVYDKESGLYYYRARYYDANTGRFTQKDPLRTELTEGNNLYVYCGNNPVNYNDPLGLYEYFHWLRYRACYWWWGWHYHWVTYGWELKLSPEETGNLAQSILIGGAVASTIIALTGLGSPAAAAVAAVTSILVIALEYCSAFGSGLYMYYYGVGTIWWC